MPQARKRYPFSPYPDGWYFASTSADLQPGEIKPLELFGRDLVLFRTKGGKAVVVNAHCPHLGAHVGIGGAVIGETIRCPFHFWRFGTDGMCVKVPYQTGGELPQVGLGTWPVDERSGLIFVWHSEDGTEPRWTLPGVREFGEEGWIGYEHRSWRIRMHVQELAENVPDIPHLATLHGQKGQLPRVEYGTDGPVYCQYLMAPDGRGGEFVFTYQELWGLGFEVIRVDAELTLTFVAAPTPIDDEYTQFNYLLLVKDKAGTGVVAPGLFEMLTAEVEADAPIWENKAYDENPHFVPGDGNVAGVREWARQFYPERRVAVSGAVSGPPAEAPQC